MQNFVMGSRSAFPRQPENQGLNKYAGWRE